MWLTLSPGEDASLPLSSGGSYQILVNNVFYFTQRVVDKLWQGMFNKDSKLVVDFIVQLIGQVQAKWPQAVFGQLMVQNVDSPK